MKNIIPNIIGYFKNPDNRRILLLLAIFIFVASYLRQCNKIDSYEAEKIRNEQNLSYYKDSLMKSINKAGEEQYARSVLTGSLNDLKHTNYQLYQEIKKQYGQILYLSKISGEMKDSISILSNFYKNAGTSTGIAADGTRYVKFFYDTTYSKGNEKHIDGIVNFKSKNDTIDEKSIKVKINSNQKFTITTGLSQDDSSKLLKIFVNPGSPNMEITSIDGAFIDPQKNDLIKSYFKPKRWTVGPQIGFGLSQNLKPGFYVGVGLQYNLQFKDIKNIFK